MVKINVFVVIMSLIIGACIKYGLYGEGAFFFCAMVFNIWMPDADETEEVDE